MNVNVSMVGFAIATIAVSLLSSTVQSHATSNMQSIDVQVGNKTYPLYYNMTNGGAINDISADAPNLTLVINVTSPSEGSLDLTFPRELYDALTFTEHSEPVVFVDRKLMDVLPTTTISCEETLIRIPLQAGMTEFELIYSDILAPHTHAYPGKIELVKTIEEQGQKFSLRLVTDAKKCDMSFVKEEKKIQIDIEGREEATSIDGGYFRLTVPHDLLGGNYTVLVDGEQTPFVEDQFFTKNYADIVVESANQDDFTPVPASHISITYPKEATRIEIIGTTALPEFGSLAMILAAASIASVLVTMSRFSKTLQGGIG